MAGNYNLGTAAGRILIDGAGAEIGFGIAQQAGKEFFNAIERQLQSLKDFGQTMLKAGAVGAAGFAVAGNAAAAFEQRLSAVRAVSGASTAEMEAISKAALEIGAATSFSATEAASAFEELVKAGISVSDTLDGAALATANLAAAGEIALPRAAEIAANAMNNFSLTGKDMPRIADLVAGAANASAISVEEFAQSLSQVGAVANLAGISFDDVAVAVAEMGNAGIKGSDAGTSLKTMLMNLQPVTTAQANKFEELGLTTFSAEKAMAAMAKKGIKPLGSSLQEVRQAVGDYLEATEGIPDDTKEMGKATTDWLKTNGAMQNAFFDSTGKAQKLSVMQEVLAKATAGMTEEQKLSSLEVLFGADAIRAAAIMAKNGAEGFNELAGSMGKVSAAGVAETRLDNVRGSIEKLKGSFETLLIQLGTVFLPIVKRVIDGLTEFVNWLTTMSDRARNFWVGLAGISTGLSLVVGGLAVVTAMIAPFLIKMAGIAIMQKVIMGVVGAVKFLGFAFTTATGPISLYRIIAAQLVIVYGQITAAAATAATAVGIFGKVLAFALGPWGKLIMLALTLVAMGVTLYNTWQPFTDVVDRLSAVINTGLGAALAFLQTVIDRLVSGFQGVEAASDPLSQVLFTLGQAANVLWQDMSRLGQLFMDNVVPALQELWTILQAAFGDAFVAISEVVQRDLLPAIQRLVEVFVNDFFPVLQQVGAFLLPIIGVILQVVGAILGGLYVGLFTLAAFIIGTVLPAIIQFAGPVLGFLISAITAVAGFIITYLITPFVDFISFLVGTVVPAIFAFGSAVYGAIGGAFTFIGDVIRTVVDAVSGFIGAIVGFFSGASQAAEGSVSGFQSMVDSVMGFFVGVGAAIGTFIMGIVQPVIDGFTAILNFIKPVTDTIAAIQMAVWNFLYAIISGIVGLILKIVQFLWGSMVIFFQVQGQILADWWNTFWATISAVFQAFAAVLTAAWTTFWNGLMAFLQPILDWFGQVIPAAWTVIVAAVAAGQAQVSQIVSDAWNFVTQMFQLAVGLIVNYVTTAWNNLVNIINGGMSLARDIIANFWNGIVANFQAIVNLLDSVTGGGFSRMVSTIGAAMEFLRLTIVRKWEEVLAFFRGIPKAIQDFFNGAGDWLAAAGRQIIDGFINGLNAAAGQITDFFKGITDMIPEIKGPPEKDKTMLIPAGKMIMKSLWLGLDDGKDAVYDLLNNMNATIPATIDAMLNPNLQSTIDGQLSGKASFTTINQAPQVNVEGAKVTANFDAKLFLGDKDITDLVDIRVEEHFDGASSLISTGVND